MGGRQGNSGRRACPLCVRRAQQRRAKRAYRGASTPRRHLSRPKSRRRPMSPSQSCLAAMCVAACVMSAMAYSPASQPLRIGRREALGAGVAAATLGVPLPAFADPIKDAALFEDDDKNVAGLGDPAIYTPSAKMDAKGASSSKLAVAMPAVGPLSKDDYVDCMWFKDANNFKVLAAEAYGSNGRSREQSLQGDTGIEPRFAARIKSGLTVIPVIHAKKGGVWEGKPFKVD